MRVFAALELPEEVLEALAGVIRTLQKQVPRGAVRWVRPEGIHLTLKFYGEVEPKRVADIQTVLAEAAKQGAAVTLTLNGLGCFPNAHKPRVVWVGVTGELEVLDTMQKAIESGSQKLGFEAEEKGFNPHLTLGRVNAPLRPDSQTALSNALKFSIKPLTFRLDELSLMKSELRPSGAVYTKMWGGKLGG